MRILVYKAIFVSLYYKIKAQMINKHSVKMSKINKIAIAISVAYFTAMVLAGCAASQQCPQTYGYDNYRPSKTHQW